MTAPYSDAALRDAKLYPQLWRLAFGLLLTGFMALTVAGSLIGAVVGLSGFLDPMVTIHVTAGLRSIQNTVQGYGTLDTPAAVMLLLLSFGGMFVGPMLAAAAFHFRDPASLFGPFRTWRRGFFTAILVQVPIMGGLLLLGAILDPPQANLAFDRWLRLLPLALALVLLQTSAEELLFRGYIQQQLAARFRSRWIWMVLPAAGFAGLHYSTTAGAGLPLILAAAFVFGLVSADLSARTGSLGAAMGMHFTNNVFGLLVIAMAEAITGLALFSAPLPQDAPGAQAIGIGVSVLIYLLVWRILRLLLTRPEVPSAD